MNIAIVGAHSATKLRAPYDAHDWQIWSLSPKNENALPRCDVWFEMHKRFLTDPDADGKEYGGWLRGHPFVYMQEQSPLILGSVAYPKNEMMAEFGSGFFTSTLAWMMALAIARRPKMVGLWGVDRNATGEYRDQRPSCLFFAHIARTRGIEFIVPDGCAMLDPDILYGYDLDR